MGAPVDEAPMTWLGRYIGRFVSFIQRYILEAGVVLATIGLAVIGDLYTLPAEERKWGTAPVDAVIGMAVIAVIGAVIAANVARGRDRRIRELEAAGGKSRERENEQESRLDEARAEIVGLQDELEQAEVDRARLVRGLFDAQLELASRELRFGNDDRISVYVYDQANAVFVRASRWAESPWYGDDGGRTIYPIAEGCLGAAWGREKVLVRDLPDHEENPQEYAEEVEKHCKVPAATLVQIRMKSRCYYGRRIKDEAGKNAGVVVFESLSPRFADEGLLAQHATVLESRLKRLVSGYRENLTNTVDGGV